MAKPDLKKLYENIVTYSERMFKNMDKFNRQDYARALKQVKAVVADAYAKYGAQGKLTYAEMQKYERIKKMDALLYEAIDGNVKNVAKRARLTLKDTVTGSYDKSNAIVTLQTGVEITKQLTGDQIIALLQKPISGLTLNERMSLRVVDLKMRVSSEVKRKILQGAPVEDTWLGVKTVMEKVYAKDRTMLADDTHRVSQEAIQASLESGLDKGIFPTLTWLTAGDDDVREAHRLLDGQTVDAGEEFEIPSGEWKGYKTYGPQQFGEAALDYGCRCLVIGGFREKKEGE
jgi:Txe/YoeB family toxin of Txe-Axe toxin-antitoxin module